VPLLLSRPWQTNEFIQWVFITRYPKYFPIRHIIPEHPPPAKGWGAPCGGGAGHVRSMRVAWEWQSIKWIRILSGPGQYLVLPVLVRDFSISWDLSNVIQGKFPPSFLRTVAEFVENSFDFALLETSENVLLPWCGPSQILQSTVSCMRHRNIYIYIYIFVCYLVCVVDKMC
jgi:hypothetical protein